MFNFLSNILTCVIVGAYYSYKALLVIYRLCLFLVEVIDKIVETLRAVFQSVAEGYRTYYDPDWRTEMIEGEE